MSLSDRIGPLRARPRPLGFKCSLKGVRPPPGLEQSRALDRERGGTPGSFGQPRFPKPLNQQLRVRLSTASDPRSNRKVGIDLKQTNRRLAGLSITSEMGESRREKVSSRMEGVLTYGFLCCDYGLVKATKLNKGRPHATQRPV